MVSPPAELPWQGSSDEDHNIHFIETEGEQFQNFYKNPMLPVTLTTILIV